MFGSVRWTGRAHRTARERSASRESVTARSAGIRQSDLFGMKS